MHGVNVSRREKTHVMTMMMKVSHQTDDFQVGATDFGIVMTRRIQEEENSREAIYKYAPPLPLLAPRPAVLTLVFALASSAHTTLIECVLPCIGSHTHTTSSWASRHAVMSGGSSVRTRSAPRLRGGERKREREREGDRERKREQRERESREKRDNEREREQREDGRIRE